MRQHEPVAIVGLACRFAGGADGDAAFWRLLAQGEDAVRPIPAARWDHTAWTSDDPAAPGRTTQAEGGFLADIDLFDAGFFGIAPREAVQMDPQQRLVLEVAWHALEHAGISPAALADQPAGVYLGLYNDNYGMIGRGSPDPALIDGWSASGTHTSVAPGRIAFQLGLTGPAIAVDTACSSSLTAVHLAVQGLRSGDCSLALAGGVHLILSPLGLVASARLGAASTSGRCRAFDAGADGFVHGEGCGVLVLKLLSEAAASGDRVLAVIRGSAVNQDGRSAGLTAPNGPSQEAVIRAALANGGLDPEAIDYIEAHGTGTALGDPIEMHALASVFGGRSRELLVGSVKTNIGHTEAAAGIAGLIKAVLMLRHQAVPASLHFARLNPHIDLGGAPIAVPTALTPRALGYVGVSSFGFSGTNAHVVLERGEIAAPGLVPGLALPPRSAVASGSVSPVPSVVGAASLPAVSSPGLARGPTASPPAARQAMDRAASPAALQAVGPRAKPGDDTGGGASRPASSARNASNHAGGGSGPRPSHVLSGKAESDPRPVHVLALSARDPAALETLATAWSEALGASGADFPALCHTAGAGRARFAQRLTVVASDAAAARAALAAAPRVTAARVRVAFLCTGQGSTHAGMAAGLAESAPVFRAVLERCDAAMGLDRPLVSLFADGAALGRTDYAQPALYALSAGLGALYRSWGIEPVAVLGHSVGEYAAAHLAGVLSLEDGARLIATRGRLMQGLPAGGAMAALLGPEAAARALLARHPAVEIAGLNSPTALTVAGPADAIERLLADPVLNGGAPGGGEMLGQKLALRHAFHSRLLEPMLDGLAAAADAVPHHAPELPVVGNLDGSVVTRHDGAYWRAHARAPVRFAAGLASLARMGCTHLLELGAQPVLSGFARGTVPGLAALPALVRARAGQDARAVGWTALSEALARLWRDGASVDWAGFDAPYRPRVADAPGYPFQRQRYWLPDPTLELGFAAPGLPAREGVPGHHSASRFQRAGTADAPEAASVPVAATPDRDPPSVGDARITGFYDELAAAAGHADEAGDGSEGHLTFGLASQAIPGFSWVRALFAGNAQPTEYAMLRRAQAALKDAIFAPVDFSQARRVLDFGCGHAADLCALATRHPHLQLDGCTISAGQVQVGRRRVERFGLADRVRIHHRDSARDPFPGRFDAIFGVEVSGLIEDKAALFDNIAIHLEPGGALAIADFVATDDVIANPDTASFTSTADEWASLLADRHLRLTDCTEVSAEIAAFLDDPGFGAEVDRLVSAHDLSPLTRRHLLSNDNIGRALRGGVMRYVLLVARHDRTTSPARLLTANRARLAAPDRWAPEAAWQNWFYRVAWQPRPLDDAVAAACDTLGAVADRAVAVDRLARAWIGAADLGSVRPIPKLARLHAHLLTLASSTEDPALLPVPDLPEARLLQRCGPRLRAVLEGRADPLDALFGDGGAAAEALYAASPAARAVNAVAGAALDAMLAGRGPVTVLEIGCGTGGTTATLFPRLRPGDRYVATDVSPGFVSTLRRRFGVEGGTLDIARPPEAQGFAVGSADIVVAANVLHATPSLRATLAHATSLLAPDGQLLLIENAGTLPWGDLTFGLTDGMWAFADTDLRPGHALLPSSGWTALLEDIGFDVTVCRPGDARTASLSGQFVLSARRRPTVPDRIWTAPASGDAAGLLDAALTEIRDAAAETVPPRLWIVTQGARAVRTGEAPNPVQATLWGMANSVAIEHPDLRLTLLDVDDPEAVAAVVASGSAETRLTVRDGQVLQARIERIAPPPARAAIRSDATYLVTGGLAGVGLAVAHWLAASGARSLALAGRTAHPVEGFPPGIEVSTHACDVADETALSALLDALARERPPLAGVFHAAGVLDDGVLAQQTPQRIARVLRPKVDGASLLDRLTRNLPIEHFVLFSSSAALVGSAAQANHAAANAFLDALAERRRAEGLPGVSIAWGAWAEIGAAARAGEGVARRGLLPMPPNAALEALGHAMTGAEPVLGVLDVDWARFLDRFPSGLVPPLFAAMAAPVAVAAGSQVTEVATARSPGLRTELTQVSEADRAALLLDRVRTAVARILGLPAGTLPESTAPLREIGLDSLMTIELRNALAAACETRLPATLVFEHPTCADLAAHLGATVFAGLLPAALSDDGLEALDAEDLARLLEQELGAADAQLAGAP